MNRILTRAALVLCAAQAVNRLRSEATQVVLASLAAVGLLAACDRPFVPIRTPDLEIVSPDTSVVQTAARLTLRLRVTSFRGISRVEVAGEPLHSVGNDLFEGEIDLNPGENRIVVVAFDSESVPSADTLRFLRQTVLRTSGPLDPYAMGGWTASLLADGTVLLLGGAPTDTSQATDRLVLFDPSTGAAREVGHMSHPRAGHAVTLLPDGRLLVTGGSARGRPRGVHDLVEEAERIDPADFSTVPLRLVGDPIRQANHTSSLRTTSEGLLVDLIGGWGDIQYRPNSDFGVRKDFRSFVIRGDSLIARHPAPGPYLERLAGHAQAELDRGEPGRGGKILVSGWTADGLDLENHALLLDTAHPAGIDVRTIAPPHEPRNDHAAVRDAGGLIWLLGGRIPSAQDPRDPAGRVARGGSVYVPSFARFLILSHEETESWPFRVRPAATLLPDGRILLAGGWSDRGTAQPTFEYLVPE